MKFYCECPDARTSICKSGWTYVSVGLACCGVSEGQVASLGCCHECVECISAGVFVDEGALCHGRVAVLVHGAERQLSVECVALCSVWRRTFVEVLVLAFEIYTKSEAVRFGLLYIGGRIYMATLGVFVWRRVENETIR